MAVGSQLQLCGLNALIGVHLNTDKSLCMMEGSTSSEVGAVEPGWDPQGRVQGLTVVHRGSGTFRPSLVAGFLDVFLQPEEPEGLSEFLPAISNKDERPTLPQFRVYHVFVSFTEPDEGQVM